MAYDLDLFLGEVEVTDGNLTIRGDEAAGGNAKIVYLQLTSIATPELPPILGDANDDGMVDDKDASILGAHWRQSGTTWANGDFNEDGYVNDMDAAILAAHWMQGSASRWFGSRAQRHRAVGDARRAACWLVEWFAAIGGVS